MKLWCLSVILLSVVAPIQQSSIKLEIGARLKKRDVPRESPNLYMTHPAQTRPYIERNIDGVDYIIAYDEKSRVIKYITTNDEDFRTANGLRVGSYIEVSKEEVIAYPGWEIRAPETSDGWYPIIGFVGGITVSSEGRDIKVNEEEMEANVKVKAKVVRFSKGGN
jgi:hypothetical protein